MDKVMGAREGIDKSRPAAPSLSLKKRHFRCKRALSSMFKQLKAIERLEDRLARTETLCSELSRDSKRLDLEFTDLYDKVRRQMSRMAKRYAVDAKENGKDTPDEPQAELDLSPDPISAAIHKRRNRGFLAQ